MKDVDARGRVAWDHVAIADDGLVVWVLPDEKAEKPHREGAPAVISAAGDQAWCRDGLLERPEGGRPRRGRWRGFGVLATPDGKKSLTRSVMRTAR
jgi:hypothetical protein